jgi:hypothetical protein
MTGAGADRTWGAIRSPRSPKVASARIRSWGWSSGPGWLSTTWPVDLAAQGGGGQAHEQAAVDPLADHPPVVDIADHLPRRLPWPQLQGAVELEPAHGDSLSFR